MYFKPPTFRPKEISVAGVKRSVPDRFRYSDEGDGQYRRFRACCDQYCLCTSSRGEGLFLWDDAIGTHQILGLSQFSASSLDQFKRKLRRWLVS